jgi:riboflavin synthase
LVFTGIVEELGTLEAKDRLGRATRMVFSAPTVSADLNVGGSVAVNGCCLTAVEAGAGWWAAEVVPETLARTNLGGLSPGDLVNLERPVQVGGRFGGHLVQGHVDGVGVVSSPAPDLEVQAGEDVLRYLVAKGPVAVDGVSLTVVCVRRSSFTVAVVPHTVSVTTLGLKGPGEQVNLEVDVIAKYVERLLHGGLTSPYVPEGAR